MKQAAWLAITVISIVLLAGCAGTQQSSAPVSAQTGLQLIEFSSPFWFSCRELAPIVNGLEQEYGDRIVFQRVNILMQKNQPLMEEYGFSTTPELYLVGADGSVIKFWDDVTSADEIRQAMDAALNETTFSE